MAHHLSERLEYWTLKITYYYAFALGLLPGPFIRGGFQKSRPYLIYSVFIQCIYLAISPLGTPMFGSEEEQKKIYMSNDVILEWIYYIGKCLRVVAIIVQSLIIWLKRQHIIDLYESYREFERKYVPLCERYPAEKEMQGEVNTMQQRTFYKFCTTHLQGLVFATIFLQIQKKLYAKYIIMILVNFFQTFFLLIANVQFFVCLSHLHLHFFYINTSLEIMALEKCPQKVGIERCWALYSMHYDYFCLSRRILRLFQPVILVMMMKIFSTNIVMLYHAVQYINGSFETDGSDNLVGSMSVFLFYWDAFLLMTVIDKILMSCNRTAEILSQFSCSNEVELEEGKSQGVDFRKLLSVFHQYLACHKLKFRLFGMFPLNKETTLQYLVSALVHVIILMQFNLKLRS